MGNRLLAVILVMMLILSGCNKQETKVETVYNLDIDSYTEMMNNLVRYSSLTEDMQSVLEDVYSDYITTSAMERLSQFRNMKYYENNESLIVVEWYDNEGDSISYPIYNSYGTIDSYGTYEEYHKSYEDFMERPLNTLATVEEYDNMLLFTYSNKYNGRLIVRAIVNGEGKIDDIAVLR